MFFYPQEHGKYVRFDESTGDWKLRNGELVHSLQHFRFPCFGDGEHGFVPNGFVHTAVVVLPNGNAYWAKCAPRFGYDEYNRKIGYRISVGKALKRTITQEVPDFVTPAGIVGNELRDHIRKELGIPGKE